MRTPLVDLLFVFLQQLHGLCKFCLGSLSLEIGRTWLFYMADDSKDYADIKIDAKHTRLVKASNSTFLAATIIWCSCWDP